MDGEKQGLVPKLGDVERIMINDLMVLSDVKSLLAFSWIEEHDSGYFWYDFKKIEDQFQLWKASISTQKYINTSIDQLDIITNDKNDLTNIISIYIQYPPDQRIKYVSQNLSNLPIRVANLIQMDLDAIFEVETPKFINDEKFSKPKLRKAKKIWLSEVEN